MRAKFLINRRVRRMFQYTAIILCFFLCIYYIIIIYSNHFERTNLKRHFHASSFHDTEQTRRLKKVLQCARQELVGTITRYGNDYWIMLNYIRGSISAQLDCAEAVTYTTTTDYGYLSYLPALVLRWLAPISLSLHAPGDDFNTTMNCIQYLRNCLPESILIRQYVTFHIYFPIDHTPADVPKDEGRALKWPYNCTVQWPPYKNVSRSAMYKTLKNVADSVNLGHNIARLAVNTHFVLQADTELIPSVGLTEQFLDMLSQNQHLLLDGTAPRVFAVPSFQVLRNAKVPVTKERLEVMLNTNLAIPLHRNICPDCHMIPKFSKWVNATLHELSVLAVVRREKKFSHWEPYFISDNKEPWFNTLFMWPGKSDRRVQGYDMCLLGYEYYLLPSFLVQRPSLKSQNLNSNSAKKNYKSITKLIRKKIIPEYIRLFGINRTKQCTGLSSE